MQGMTWCHMSSHLSQDGKHWYFPKWNWIQKTHDYELEISPIDDLMSPMIQNGFILSLFLSFYFFSSTVSSEFADSGELFLKFLYLLYPQKSVCFHSNSLEAVLLPDVFPMYTFPQRRCAVCQLCTVHPCRLSAANNSFASVDVFFLESLCDHFCIVSPPLSLILFLLLWTPFRGPEYEVRVFYCPSARMLVKGLWGVFALLMQTRVTGGGVMA